MTRWRCRPAFTLYLYQMKATRQQVSKRVVMFSTSGTPIVCGCGSGSGCGSGLWMWMHVVIQAGKLTPGRSLKNFGDLRRHLIFPCSGVSAVYPLT